MEYNEEEKNERFIDIVNANFIDKPQFDFTETVIQTTPIFLDENEPTTSYLIPTQIPGLFIGISIDFDKGNESW